MSVNVWLSVQAQGFEATRVDAVRDVILELLRREQLLDQLQPPSGRAPIVLLEAFDGGPVLCGGSSRPVILSGSGAFAERVGAELAQAAIAAGGPATRCSFSQVDADGSWIEMDAAEQHFARLAHYVENVLGQEIENERGSSVEPHLPALLALRSRLSTWDQLEALAHLLLDYTTRSEVRALHLDLLRAPPSLRAGSARHVTQTTALELLDGHRGYTHAYANAPDLVARLAARVAAGSSVREAHSQERQGDEGPLGALEWTQPTEPFAWARKQLDLDERFARFADLERVVAARVPVAKPMATLAGALALELEDRRLCVRTIEHDDWSLRVELGEDDQLMWPVVAAMRELLEDGVRFDAMLSRAAAKAAPDRT